MSTYSINDGTPFESTFLGDLSLNVILNEIPNNTSQLIVPENVRNTLFTLWDNISFKIVAATGSSVSYIGVGGQIHTEKYANGADGLKVLMGKPQLNNSDILNDFLIEYDDNTPNSNSDFYFYNFKPDDFSNGSANKQFTKVSFLAGDNTNNLFNTAPYLQAQQNVGNTAINFTIFNEGGKLIIDSADELQIGSTSTRVTLLSGTGSTGVKTLPAGEPGDLQLNLDDCEFGFVNGLSASEGNVLLMGASNSPFWGDLNINSIFTLNQVLNSGNTTDGADMIVTTNDRVYFGATGSTYTSMYNNGSYTLIESTGGEFRIDTNLLRLDITGVGANKVLYTDGTGYAFWATQSITDPGSPTNSIQFNDSGNFGGSALLTWDNVNGSMDVNNTGQQFTLALAANASGGIYMDANEQQDLIQVDWAGTDLMYLYKTDNEDYAFKLNNQQLDDSDYMLNMKSNSLGGILLDTGVDEEGQSAVRVINENFRFFEIDIVDYEHPVVNINGDNTSYALNVRANEAGGLHVSDISSGRVMLVENLGGEIYFEIDDAVNEMTFADAGDFSFMFSGLATELQNKYTFKNGSGTSDFTFLAESADQEFKLEYDNGSSTVDSLVSFSPGNSKGMFLGVNNGETEALYLGDFSGGTYDGSVVIYPQPATADPIMERLTSKSVVIGNSSKDTQTPGTEVSVQDDKRSLGINIVPQVDHHLNGVYAVNPEMNAEDGLIFYNGAYFYLGDVNSSYITLDSDSDGGKTLHRIGSIASEPAAAYGTTLRVWNRTGISVFVDQIYNFSGAAGRNIFIPSLATPGPTFEWTTGTMLEFVYLQAGGDMITILGGIGNPTPGVWYMIN